MKIQNLCNSAQTPSFKAFLIEKPITVCSNKTQNNQSFSEDKYKFRGTDRFLFEETSLIRIAKKEVQDYTFPEPIEKIIEVIQRQKKNPFNLVMYAKEFSDPRDDRIFLAIKDPEGNIVHEREIYNSVNLIDTGDGKKKILSHFYSILNIGEKLADRYANRT